MGAKQQFLGSPVKKRWLLEATAMSSQGLEIGSSAPEVRQSGVLRNLPEPPSVLSKGSHEGSPPWEPCGCRKKQYPAAAPNSLAFEEEEDGSDDPIPSLLVVPALSNPLPSLHLISLGSPL